MKNVPWRNAAMRYILGSCFTVTALRKYLDGGALVYFGWKALEGVGPEFFIGFPTSVKTVRVFEFTRLGPTFVRVCRRGYEMSRAEFMCWCCRGWYNSASGGPIEFLFWYFFACVNRLSSISRGGWGDLSFGWKDASLNIGHFTDVGFLFRRKAGRRKWDFMWLKCTEAGGRLSPPQAVYLSKAKEVAELRNRYFFSPVRGYSAIRDVVLKTRRGLFW